MRNTIQKYGRLTALFLAVTLCVSGCGSSGESSLNYRPQMQTGTVVASGGAYSLDYLSQDICVIPKNKQSKEGSDSVMTAGASMIVNDTKQKMLFSKNIYDRMYPASITKIVTALVTLKYGNLDDTVTFSHDAANITEYGAKLCGFKEGDKIVLRDLLYSFLVFSGNDAGVAIAEHVGGSVEKFVDMMNDEVKNLVKDTIHANGIDIGIYTQDFENEFISLTDIARYKSDEPKDVIKNWMRSKDTIEFLGLWEKLHNSNFKGVEFDSFRNQAGSNAFTMSPTKWIETTGAIGIVSKSGRYGGTFAHSDIAFEFASWISAEFKLYIIKDYKRLKADENSRFSLNWNLNREISKLNYRIHTDAIKEKLIPPELTPAQISFTYANEADMLNVVLFGRTAKQWKDENPDIKGNMRDGATLNQLLILANLESYNAVLIHQGKNQKERMELLRQLALQQIRTLESISTDKLPRLR